MKSGQDFLKFIPTKNSIVRQRTSYLLIIALYVGGFIYLNGLTHYRVRMIMILFWLVTFLVTLATQTLTMLPSLNYMELRAEGIKFHSMGFIDKYIYWADIEHIEDITFLGANGVGILNWKDIRSKNNWFRRYMYKKYGWDAMITNGFENNGNTLSEKIIREFIMNSDGTRKIAKYID